MPVEKLNHPWASPRTDRYSVSRGITGLRPRAQAAHYDRRFGVKLNPEPPLVATLGSKEGFANVAPRRSLRPATSVLCPNPSYPIHAFGFLMAVGRTRSVPSEPTPQFFEAVERAIIHSIPKPIALIVCYPSNPTAYVADLDFYRGSGRVSRRSTRSSSCRIWPTPSATAPRRTSRLPAADLPSCPAERFPPVRRGACGRCRASRGCIPPDRSAPRSPRPGSA